MTCKCSFESHIRSLDGDYNLMMVGDVYIDAETQIEWRTWQKAWQAALASQQPADDGWIEWSGGDCPVFAYSLVETKWSSGAIVEDCAGEFDWSFEDGSCNIIAYRVVKP